MATMAKSEKSAEKKIASGLGKPEEKKPRHKKSVHVHIEPTSNKGFIVKHTPHEDGMPMGASKTHAFPDAASMHKHIQKTFPVSAAAPEAAPAAEVVPPAAAATASPAPPAGM